ncbi:hypothetical protein RvY_06631 [Ramazzottius varieornatus]|uniref:Uncharacterized protein n=1 Tax=Ramazzottius varieornatus TaxID=947166 RepID=A0A1D1V7Y0_RAMVA|nr:hypothetical protein RvY_06631 [Ramazzottius varieornatus]
MLNSSFRSLSLLLCEFSDFQARVPNSMSANTDAVQDYVKNLPESPEEKSPVEEITPRKDRFAEKRDEREEKYKAFRWSISECESDISEPESATCDNRSAVPDTPKWVVQRKRELEQDDPSDDSSLSEEVIEKPVNKAKRVLKF